MSGAGAALRAAGGTAAAAAEQQAWPSRRLASTVA